MCGYDMTKCEITKVYQYFLQAMYDSTWLYMDTPNKKLTFSSSGITQMQYVLSSCCLFEYYLHSSLSGVACVILIWRLFTNMYLFQVVFVKTQQNLGLFQTYNIRLLLRVVISYPISKIMLLSSSRLHLAEVWHLFNVWFKSYTNGCQRKAI